MRPADDLWGEWSRPSVSGLVYDVGSALLAGCLVLLATYPRGSWLLTTAAVLLVGALAVRRLSWPLMFGLSLVAGVLQLVAHDVAFVADAIYAPVGFTLGAHPDHRVRRAGLAAVVGAVLALMAAVALGGMRPAGLDPTVFQTGMAGALAALIAGGGWAAGYIRWQRRARVTAQVQAGLDQERTRIATDMHDLVAHTWAVVAAQADGARYALGGPDGRQEAAAALDVIADTARTSMSELQDLLAELRYAEPVSPPGRVARDALLARMRASGMELRLVEHGTPPTDLPAVAVQRLLSEALTNALKHGDLDHPVQVEEDWRDGYRLVARNRRGASRGTGTGHGLDGMRERVVRAGGVLDAGPRGEEWLVTVELPGGGR